VLFINDHILSLHAHLVYLNTAVYFQVKALYDFNGEPETTELSITAGEVLTVTRQNVGEGWWEGVNQAGEMGIFPAAYVEVRFLIHCSEFSYTQSRELK